MPVDAKIHNQIAIIRPLGNVDKSSAEEMNDLIKSAFNSGISSIIFDLSTSENISSDGLRVILKAITCLRAAQGFAAIVGLGETARSTLKMSGFFMLLKEYATLTDAINDLERISNKINVGD